MMTLLNTSLLEFSPLGIHFAKTIKDITDNAKRIRYMSLGGGGAMSKIPNRDAEI